MGFRITSLLRALYVTLFVVMVAVPSSFFLAPVAHADGPSVSTADATNISQTDVTLGGSLLTPGDSGTFQTGVTWDTHTGTDYGSYTYVEHTDSVATADYTLDVAGLTCSTTYYYRAFALGDDFSGDAVGDEKTFTTADCDGGGGGGGGGSPTPPTVITDDATGVTDSFASLGFDVTDTGSSDMSIIGFKYATDAYYTAHGNTYDSDLHYNASFPNTQGGFDNLSELSCGTEYHFEAYGINQENAIGYGSDDTFTTSACVDNTPPTISITAPQAGAIGAFNPIVDWGDSSSCEYSFDGSAYSPATCGDNGSDIPAPDSAGDYTLYVIGTDSSHNASDPVSVAFTYDPAAPSAITGAASSITDTTATLHGDAEGISGGNIDHLAMRYATDAYYTAHGNTYGDGLAGVVNNGAPTVGYDFTAGGLTCGTEYHYQAYSYNDGNDSIGYGADETFTTSACDDSGPPAPPTIVITAPTTGTVTDWSPSIDWDTSTSCEYSYDDSTFTDVDCGNNGSDISAPPENGDYTLYLQGTDSSDQTAVAQISFTYEDTGDQTLTVTTLADDGDGTCTVDSCTFRDAIANAQDGDLITFADGVVGTTTLTESAPLVLAHDVSIVGPGKDMLTIDFNNDSNNYIDLQGDGITNVSGLTFTNANNSVFLDQTSDTSELDISDSAFTNNTVNQALLFLHGAVSVTNTLFLDNTAENNLGGAIYVNSSGDLTIASSTFTGNTYTGGDGVTVVGAGAVDYEGTGNMDIASSTFSYNAGSDGGAVAFHNGNALTISNSKFLHNNSEGFVGALDAQGESLSIDTSTFSYNTDEGGGYGTIYTSANGAIITDSTFDHNTVTDTMSGSGGGAIFNQGGFVIFGNDTFVDNTVNGTEVLGGGAVFNAGLLALINSTFSGNSAGDGSIGDSVYSAGEADTILGNSIFQSNSPNGCMGDGGYEYGGGDVDSGTTCSEMDNGDLQNTDARFSLAGLADNGGLVQTIALRGDSPAIDFGVDNFFDVGVDARGVARPQGIAADSGAYEFVGNDDSVAPVSYDGGSGTPDDPYLISTCEELQGIGQDDAHLAASYRITQDFSCEQTSTVDTESEHYDASLYNDGAGFNPIGSVGHPFTGTLTASNTDEGDGGFTINDISIHRPDEDNVGIFASTNNATIEHLYLHGIVNGNNDVGFVAGSVASTTIDDVDTGFSQLISGVTNVGGLVGYMASSTLTGSNFDGEVRGNLNVGGIVGSFDGNANVNLNHGDLNDDRSTGTITANGDDPSHIGGLAGSFMNGTLFSSQVDNDGSAVTVDGSDGATDVGGLIGYAYNAYLGGDMANTNVRGKGDVGGLIGDAEMSFVVVSHTHGSVTGSDGESPVSDASGFGGFIGYSGDHILLAQNESDSTVTVYAGNGSVSDIGGFIGSACDEGTNCRFSDTIETGDVTVNGTTDDGESSTITTVGTFAGYMNGADDHDDSDFLGPGFTEGSASGNLTITQENNVHADAQLVENVGGLFGGTDNALITQSYSTGGVTITAPSARTVGGLLGNMHDSEVDDSYSQSSLTLGGGTFNTIGGLVGALYGDGAINRSYSSGSVAFTPVDDASIQNVGGLVGDMTDSTTVADSWSASDLGTFDADTSGGLIGDYEIDDSFASLSDDYYRHALPNSPYCVGSDGAHELDILDGEVSRCINVSAADADVGYFFSSDSAPMAGNWDFSDDDIWVTQSEGYPLLAFSNTDTTPPDAGTTGAVTAYGGTVVADTFNLSNNGIDVEVPLDTDSSLVGGTVDWQVSINGGDWVGRDDTAHTIQEEDLGNSVSLSLNGATIRAIDGYADGATISFRAVVTDASNNSTTFSPSADVLTVSTTMAQGPVETILDTNQFAGGGVAQGWHADDHNWQYNLPFPFTFYGQTYTTVYVDSNGYLSFSNGGAIDSYTPTVQEGIGVPTIFAYGNDLVTNEDDDDIFVTDNDDGTVTFRWVASDIDNEGSVANFEIVLNRNNTFHINYGPQTAPINDATAVGVSDGNGSYVASAYDGRTDFNELTTSSWVPPGGDISGCTNAQASNYNSAATNDDGSCAVAVTPSGGHSSSGGGSGAVVGITAPATLAAQIQALEAKIKALLAAQSTKNAPVPSPLVHARDLYIGMRGDDVHSLQLLLISQGYRIPAGATGFFASQTAAALAAYQRAHGITPAVGYFGPLTRAQMKSALLPGLWW